MSRCAIEWKDTGEKVGENVRRLSLNMHVRFRRQRRFLYAENFNK